MNLENRTSWRSLDSPRGWRGFGPGSTSGRVRVSRGSRVSGNGVRGRGARRGGRGGWNGSQPCQNFLQTGQCLSGTNCPYSHEIDGESQARRPSRENRERPQETEEQQQAKSDYRIWKQLIRRAPQANDTEGIYHLWSGALDILNDDDRDLKQQLPRDLNDEDNCGKQHIRNLMSMEVQGKAHSTFVTLAAPFMSVITHRALLDCMSVDSAVGGLYSYISGMDNPNIRLYNSNLDTNIRALRHQRFSCNTLLPPPESKLVRQVS